MEIFFLDLTSHKVTEKFVVHSVIVDIKFKDMEEGAREDGNQRGRGQETVFII